MGREPEPRRSAAAGAASAPAAPPDSAEAPATGTNRLAHATSPYLLQHAHNPVDWYEWGPAALARARAEDKPIFLSIGYSACHWCHVMAHESFADPAVAAVMNAHVVNLKVDREERPDLDEIYMQATLLMNRGQGGWPLSVWLTPDGKPFFAGTYFPPQSRWGRPGFRELCARIGELWQTNRAALLSDADQLADMVAQSLATPATPTAITLADIDHVVQTLADAFDAQRGGLISGGTNKFPPSMALDLFLRAARRYGDESATTRRLHELVQLTLENMARGGIYDQLAGGICRYSTDVFWHVPHFEKMLYDQALVSRSYIDAYQVFGKPHYARVAREIFDYVLDDLRSPQGGFYSSRDADSEGEEGRYYVWTRDEILAALGPDDGAVVCSYYDVSETGNWSDPHAPDVPKNVLHAPRDYQTIAALHHLEAADVERIVDSARQKLRAVRAQRVAPGRDEKILVEWNGLMISSLARGGAVLGEPRYIQAAARAADFVLTHQVQGGRLRRALRAGRTTDSAFLTDYAALIEGLLVLSEATFERRWLDSARELNRVVLTHFGDPAAGGFFFTAADHESLIARSKDVRDGATPSGNSLHLMNLLRLAALLGDAELRRAADALLEQCAGDVLAAPGSGERFLAAAEFALLGPVELAFVGDPTRSDLQALLAHARRTYLPNRIMLLLDTARPDNRIDSPLLAGRTAIGGRATAYVCRDYVCQRPVTDPAEFAAQLKP